MWGSGNCDCCGPSTLNDIDNAIERIVNEASYVKCPNCEAPSHRESDCTHLKCGSCNIHFCYFCGIKITLRGLNSDHNVNFRSDKSKCPLFLHSHPFIQGAKSDEERGSVFIFYRTLRMLRELKSRYPANEWNAAVERNTNDIFTDIVLPDYCIKSPAPFNFKYALTTDFPNPQNYKYALP